MSRTRTSAALFFAGLLLLLMATPYEAFSSLLAISTIRPVGGSGLVPVPKDGVLMINISLSKGGKLAHDHIDRLDIALQASDPSYSCLGGSRCYTLAYTLYLDNSLSSSRSRAVSVTTTATTITFSFSPLNQTSAQNLSIIINVVRSS